mmetsp:Transcript_3110/g.8121  ORF Transcript_3110/g.8121 Transcript_3110/m.8121 type:complete len:354 (-) Transcript_3110:345-1406(-)
MLTSNSLNPLRTVRLFLATVLLCPSPQLLCAARDVNSREDQQQFPTLLSSFPQGRIHLRRRERTLADSDQITKRAERLRERQELRDTKQAWRVHKKMCRRVKDEDCDTLKKRNFFANVKKFGATKKLPPIVQNDPIIVNDHITCIATEYNATNVREEEISVQVPEETRDGDILLAFIGGSSGNIMPSGPIPGFGWKPVVQMGMADINCKAWIKVFSSKEDVSAYKVDEGRNKYAILSVMRGVDNADPVVAYSADIDSAWGSLGDAVAPAVDTVHNGAIVVVVIYDDAHRAIPVHDGIHPVVSFIHGKDGMASAVGSSPNGGGRYGPFEFNGYGSVRGGGDDVVLSLSFRPLIH